MSDLTFRERIVHAYNAFQNRDPTRIQVQDIGSSSYRRPDRTRVSRGNERSIVASVYNRIAMDVSQISIRHVRLDENGSYEDDIKSDLYNCLTLEANLDQTSRAFFQDLALSLFDEGCVAVVPTHTDDTPNATGSYKIFAMRVGRITQWYPKHVTVDLYNDETGLHEELLLEKKTVAIIENPLYAVMNEPNSTLQRLIRKLNLLDGIDEQSGSGKLDLIIQLPYIIKSEARRIQAEERRKAIEDQLSGSKYGIAYTDGTERVTQLNRPAENNLMSQIQYLTSMLYSQLGITEEVFNGTADEATMLNYTDRTVEPVVSAIVDEFKRKFLTKTARSQGQSIMYFKNLFRLVPSDELADVADKYTRNEIMTGNEMRSVIGLKPSKDPRADELRNKNINAPTEGTEPSAPTEPEAESTNQ